jgi:tRNA 5-methylaminomethyl-2-thiouridine biosynthesis bifunctional protein
LRATASLAPRIALGAVQGSLQGLLRLVPGGTVAILREQLAQQGLPGSYVEALDPATAGDRARMAFAQAAWWFPQGGWVDPRSIVRDALAQAAVELRLQTPVWAIERGADRRLRLLDRDGHCAAVCDHVVMANAHDALRLAGRPLGRWRSTRGQVTLLCHAAALLRPACPIAGDSYAIALPDGALLCGATRDEADTEPAVRASDQQRNLAALEKLLASTIDVDIAGLHGRVGWRLETADRLPLVGALPLRDAAPSPRDGEPRFVSREDGLHILAGLGSRGIAQSALGAEIVASWISGAPLPVGRSLLDVVDVARVAARAARARAY